jgi:hypothetical protein
MVKRIPDLKIAAFKFHIEQFFKIQITTDFFLKNRLTTKTDLKGANSYFFKSAFYGLLQRILCMII